MNKIIFEFSETVLVLDDITITLEATSTEVLFAAATHQCACRRYAKRDRNVEGRSRRTSSNDATKGTRYRMRKGKNSNR